MINKTSFKDFKAAKEEIEKEMINNLLEYLRNGILPNNNPNSYMNAYVAVNDCANEGDNPRRQLLEYHNKTIELYIQDCYNKLIEENTHNLINAFIYYTDHITLLIYWMNIIFGYLDRFFTLTKIKVTLAKSALNIYEQNFFEKIKIDVFIEVDKLIKEDRKGNREFRQKIKAVMEIIRCLDLETPKILKENNKISWIALTNKEEVETKIQSLWFDDFFEKETKKFAEDKGNKDINSLSAPEYVLSQLKYLDEEDGRKKGFIHKKFHGRINEINYKYLIGDHMKQLSEKDTGIKNMFETKSYPQLANLYKLFKLYTPSLDYITNEFKTYIKKRGNTLYTNKDLSKDPIKFIPELIKLKNEMNELVSKCFENNINFNNVIDEAFRLFMEKDIYSKQLANYIDHCMRKNFSGKSNEEIEVILNDVVYLFKCLKSKIVFQAEADKKMSDRLINDRSISKTAESILVKKLMQEAGVSFVSKMQEMIKDLEKNKVDSENYKLSGNKGAPNGIKLDITVVSQSAWDIHKKVTEKFIMPDFLSSCLNDFEQFYLKRHQTQKLIWCLGLSKLDIKYLYLKQNYVSTSTLPQFLALLLLEKKERLTLGKIAELCGCPAATIITDINGLIFNTSFNHNSSPDKGIIKSNFNTKTKEFKEADEIWINKNFVAPKLKISTIPLPKKKTASEEKAAQKEEAQIIKRYQDNILQATLTRIMKSRIGQETTHTWLISTATSQIDLFEAQPAQIKENIERLIEKNVIKRNERNRNCYDYIA